MAYRSEKNSETGQPEIVIDGWENGIAVSPYAGITSLKNLNIRYLPGAVYSNYKRIINTSASTIALPKYWTQDPTTGTYYIIDSSGQVWKSSDPSSVAWTQLTGNSAHLGGGQGLAVYKNYLFVFKNSSIDYYNISGSSWVFDWQTGLQPNVDHMALWGQDDILYFCNGAPPSTAGSSVGSLSTVPTMVFDPTDPTTYVFNNVAIALPGFEQSITWLSELLVNLIISAGKRLYPWDRSSTNTGIPVFIKENILRVVNILNILYITAGVKGNIYKSNGYSISPWVKIPDSFFGVIDPGITFGDMMSHRNKLYVGVSLLDSPFTNGVFSIDLDDKTINFENQNSYGLNASGVSNGFGQPSVLIDLEAASYDNYASAWFNGSIGGMDTNTTVLYTGGETAIETDLIPVGTFLHPQTFENIEFKLDEPMQANDTITIFARPSFSASYTQLGITTSAVLSDVYTPLVIEKSQWLQFKIVLTPGANNHFIRLREMRLRY